MSRKWNKPNRSLPGWDYERMSRAGNAYSNPPTRKFLKRYRRKFGHKCKVKFSQSKPDRIVRPMATLIAVDSLGNQHFATYHKNKLGLWKFHSSTPILSFLRFCGTQDAKKALAKRHLKYSWSMQCDSKSIDQASNPVHGELERQLPASCAPR